jgi:hypothetical protein
MEKSPFYKLKIIPAQSLCFGKAFTSPVGGYTGRGA